MKLRFLRVTPAVTPEFPFQIGQVITIDKLTDEMRVWLEDGNAEIVRDDSDTDIADAPDIERSVTQKGRPRR